MSDIHDKTLALVDQFKKQRANKRNEGFDMNGYFSLLEQIQKSNMPLLPDEIELARDEQKREKWIKKYNDIQLAGKSDTLQQSQILEDSQVGGSNVRIKNLEALVK